MQEDMLIQISYKIKDIRKQKNITVQELANKASVSKGLISQIENNRTVPSLPVLMKIIQALNLDMNDFFKDITTPKKAPPKVIIKKPKDYQVFEKETAKGFVYKRIITRNLQSGPMDIVLLELKKGAKRSKMVKTEAYEYKYIIKGKVEYIINDKTYILEEGDSLFFDGRLGHKPSNIGPGDALILVTYLFITNNK
ncbi:MAG: helix-turn-helix domain-containing protein [Chitinophagaceae bacterium]